MGIFDLSGKVAVVIGGGGVLGGAIARGFGEAGASVAILGRTPGKAEGAAASLRSDGLVAVGIDVDAISRDELERGCAQVVNDLGTPEVLVNAVGVNSATPFAEISTQEWSRILDSNLTATFLACQVFARQMEVAGRGGSIINFSSASSGPPLSKVLAYGASKAAVNSVTQYLARELAGHGIRVNAILPGFFPAEQNRRLLSPERVEAIIRHTPMRRLGEPTELVGTAIWLASSSASGFVTGALVRVDGGFSAMTI